MKATITIDPPPLDFREVLLQYHPSTYEPLEGSTNAENKIDQLIPEESPRFPENENSKSLTTNELEFPIEEELPILDKLKDVDKVLQSKDLFYSLSEGKLAEAQKLIEEGADNSFHHSETRQTPLHWACAIGDAGMAKILIERNGNPFETQQTSPFHQACMNNQKDMVKWLLTYPNAEINQKDIAGFTGLHWVCEQGNIELARLLLAHNASPILQDEDGNTPIHIASVYGYDDFAKEMSQLSENSLYIPNIDGIKPIDLLPGGSINCIMPQRCIIS